MAKQPILTLDIGSHALKLAEFTEVRGGLEMTRYAVSDLGLDPQSDADRSQYIITTIHDLLAESGCKPGPVQVSIAGHSVFSRFVKLPPVDPAKVYQIVQYEAAQHVPFPMNEVVWDYQLVSGSGGDVDVMIAAVKTEIINQVCDCVTFAGLKPDLIDVAPMALYNAVRYNYDNLPECTLVVDIGARSTDLVFIEGGRVFSRNVPVAGNQITQSIQNEFGCSFDDAEALKKSHAYVGFGGPYEPPKSETVDKVSKSVRSMMTRLHQELNRSINFYRGQQGGSAPKLLLLTGGSSVIPYADAFLREKLKIETDLFNPFNNVAVAENIPAEQVGAHAAEMGSLAGLALRKLHTCPVEINLLPPKAEEEKRFKKKLPYFGMAALTALLALGVWVVGYDKMASRADDAETRVERRVRDLSDKESALEGTEEVVKDFEARIGRLTALESGRGAWRKVFAEINAALPEGMWITHVAALLEMPQETKPADDEDESPRSRRNRRNGGDDDAASAAAGPNPRLLPGVLIEGMGYTDIVKPEAVQATVQRFRDALKESDLFSDKTEVIYLPPVTSEASTFEFKISARLKEPKEL
ncbi:MAG: type IV pilus assembly protein PilM [Kiritimatiellae bacterium]|nr:type IV pilus assembly protein PilM [Kiritimatiellia bacterium]